jgi:hypothetical protein
MTYSLILIGAGDIIAGFNMSKIQFKRFSAYGREFAGTD